MIKAFLAWVATDPRIAIAQGQCVETYCTGEPYMPVLDALARFCRDAASDHFVALLRPHAPTWLAQMPWLLDAADREALQREPLGATSERMLRGGDSRP